MPETQWMTLTETAEMMKRLPDQVTQMCEDGKLEYYMEDGRYFVSRESIDLFMHPPIGQPAPATPDSNGTPRRQYGRAPHESAPSPESASDSQAVNGPDEVDGAGGSEPEDSMEVTPDRGDEVAETAEDEEPAAYARPADEPTAMDEPAEQARPADEPTATEDPVGPEDLVDAAEDGQHAEDVQRPRTAGHSDEDELQIAGHSVEDEIQMEPTDDAAPPDEVPPDDNAGPERPTQAGEQVEAKVDPGEPEVNVAEILAELRAALSRHALEHKAFCDEIAGMADALESTLSHDDDKTNELTREISSLLARYTRR